MKAVFFIILCLAVFTGCGDGAVTSPSNQSSEYYPLQIGNEWRYIETRNYNYDTVGIYKISVVSKEEINGKIYFKLSDSAKYAEKTRGERYERIEDEKLYYYKNGYSKEVLDIDFVNRDNSVGSFYGSLDKVEYPIGTFYNVKQINWLQVDYSSFNEYAPGIGLISSTSNGVRRELVYAKISDKIYQ
ncbi:MAG: hypothetical protein HYZ54_11290 [Ignavibacteriae bacterium]|nr:hypothetical protein [Ignavibacteriota bacterium]